jgi:tRNA(Ile)-lysidine synthase
MAYLDKYSIPYLEDSSNLEDIYLRNRIRKDLLPYLSDRYNPDIKKNLLRTANILQDEEELLESITEEAFKAVVSTSPAAEIPVSTTDYPPGKISIALQQFCSQHSAIQRRILEKACWQMGCKPSAGQIEQLLKLSHTGAPNSSLHLAEGLRANRDPDQLLFHYPKGRGPFRGTLNDTGEEPFEMQLQGPGVYELYELNKKLVIEVLEDEFPGPHGEFPQGDFLDGDLFSFPLTLRSPQPGDRFHPLGSPGSKKVHDFLIDQKVPQQKRSRVPVLCANDTILALLSFRIDQRFRITDRTSRVIRFHLREL